MFARINGWEPKYHSFDEIRQFDEDVKKLTEEKGNSKTVDIVLRRPITQKYKDEITRFVLNEQALCALDCAYWENNYAYVCDEESRIYKFKPRNSQRIYNAVVADFDERQVSIELLILKARQLGITTQTALKFIHRMLFVKHTQAIMASVKEKASQLIGRIQNTVYENCPWWLIPMRTTKGGFDNGSVLSIQSGMQATGLAQGWTPTLAHISEVGDIPNPEKTIEEGLMRAMHISPALFLVLEGTGAGNIGWLADTWRAAKEKFPKGLHRLCPIFISWPCCPEIYPKPGFLTKFPVPETFYERRTEATKKHVARCEAYIRNTPYLSRIMGTNYRMPIEQQWFWEWNYLQSVDNHTQRTWAAQMPADDFEALTGEHDSVFEADVMGEVEDRIYEVRGTEQVRRVPMQAYAITGESIDDGFEPDKNKIDWDKPVIRVTWRSHRNVTYRWEMIPLKPLDENKELDTFDKVLIYEEPLAGADYSCGIDTAYGLGAEDEDRTVVSMVRNRKGAEFDYQVAELTSNRMNSAQVVGFAACMAAFYGEKTRDWRGVKFCIEQITGPGDTCQHQLKLMGFNYHHIPRRYDSKRVKDDSSKKEGWYSTGWSVPILMTRFIEAVNGGWFRPASKWLIEEMRSLERHVGGGGKAKMEHREGMHDDRVRASAQAYFTAHDLDDLADRAQRRYMMPEKKKKDVNGGRCMTNTVKIGEDWE